MLNRNEVKALPGWYLHPACSLLDFSIDNICCIFSPIPGAKMGENIQQLVFRILINKQIIKGSGWDLKPGSPNLFYLHPR